MMFELVSLLTSLLVQSSHQYSNTILNDCLEGLEHAITHLQGDSRTIELNGTTTTITKTELEEVREDYTTLVQQSAKTLRELYS